MNCKVFYLADGFLCNLCPYFDSVFVQLRVIPRTRDRFVEMVVVVECYLRGDTHMTSTLTGAGERVRQKWDVIGHKGWWVGECSGHPTFIFFIEENWISTTTAYNAEPNNILLTRNLLFHSDVWQWSHPLLMPLHCSWAKWNNRTCCQFECDLS